MRPATRGASRAQLQSCRRAESSAADASGRRRQEVRRRAARRRNRTSDDVDVALDFATRCEVLVWVDARRNLLFPRPLLKLLVLLALHDCEGRKRRRGLAHRAHAASAHHQRIGCRCQARNDEEARRRHAPELSDPEVSSGRKQRTVGCQSVSHLKTWVITTLLPTEHMVHYTRSENVAEWHKSPASGTDTGHWFLCCYGFTPCGFADRCLPRMP